MKALSFALLVCLSGSVFGSVGCASSGGTRVSDANPHLGRVRHVVFFKFKDTATPQQIRDLEIAFAKLKSEIPLIRDYEWGTNNSPENLAAGHTHCFLVTFDTPADRDAYLPHKAHKAFVEKLLPLLDKATVLDFIAKSDA